MNNRILLGAFALLGVFVIENPHCGGTTEHRQLAFYYLEQEQYERALIEARRAARQDRSGASAHFIAAMAQLGLGRDEEAVADISRAILAEPGDERLYAALRQICQERGRFDLAREALSGVLEEQPDNSPAQATLGWAYARLGDDERAGQWLERAAAGDSAAAFARLQLSALYLRGARFAEAIQALEPALARAPRDPELLVAAGECYLRWGRPEEAGERFAAALEHSGERAAIAGRIAMVHYELGRRRQAIEYYELAVRQGAPLPSLLNNLAWTYGEEGVKLDRALDLSMQAVKSEPDNPVYLDTYAELFYKKGEYARAIALMRRALESEPEGGEQREYLIGQMEKFHKAIGRPYSPSL